MHPWCLLRACPPPRGKRARTVEGLRVHGHRLLDNLHADDLALFHLLEMRHARLQRGVVPAGHGAAHRVQHTRTTFVCPQRSFARTASLRSTREQYVCRHVATSPAWRHGGDTRWHPTAGEDREPRVPEELLLALGAPQLTPASHADCGPQRPRATHPKRMCRSAPCAPHELNWRDPTRQICERGRRARSPQAADSASRP